jgi:alkaline phosphatase D
MHKPPTRRALVAGLATAAAGPAAARDIAEGRPIRRIAFGSCAKETKDQPIWDTVLDAKPDLFVMLGDAIYADTRDPRVMAEKYARLAAKPGFRRLREQVEVRAIWDDHDYGENDAGADYPMKAEARRQFCDFWRVPADSPRRTRPDGIFHAEILGPAGRQVQLILPDLRWNRTPILRALSNGRLIGAAARGALGSDAPQPGPYARNPDGAATMLGETQWRWLEETLRAPAQVRLFASSLQVVADFPGWEAWSVYARDQQRLIAAIRRTRAEGLICISGDTHYGELSRLDDNVPYPLWDLTSSGLTEVWPATPPNARRTQPILRARNFGMVEIDWHVGRLEL